jgi:hypothetical protein
MLLVVWLVMNHAFLDIMNVIFWGCNFHLVLSTLRFSDVPHVPFMLLVIWFKNHVFLDFLNVFSIFFKVSSLALYTFVFKLLLLLTF